MVFIKQNLTQFPDKCYRYLLAIIGFQKLDIRFQKLDIQICLENEEVLKNTKWLQK